MGSTRRRDVPLAGAGGPLFPSPFRAIPRACGAIPELPESRAIGALPIARPAWERAFRMIPKASIERPGASKALQKGFHRLQKISFSFPELRIINGLRANGGQKNRRDRPGAAPPPRRTVPTRENRHPGGLRIPLEACPRPSRFSPFRRGPSTRRRRLVEHIVNNARLSRQSVVSYNSRAEARRSADFPLPSRPKAPGRRRRRAAKACQPAERGMLQHA